MFYETSFYQYLSLERRYSVHTLTAYQSDLESFVHFCTEHQCLASIEDVRHWHIRAWVVSLMQHGEQPRTINRRLSCLKSYFKLLKKKGVVSKDPMQKVVSPKQGKRLPVFMQENQVKALFSTVEYEDGYMGTLHRTLLEVLYGTGIRRSEASALKLTDIDHSRGVIRILGKGNKERMVPAARYLLDIIDIFIAMRATTFAPTDQPWLFLNKKGTQITPENIYQIVKKHLSAVSTVEQRSPHVLRHSFATHLSNNGADLNAIKTLLGHANLSATQIYMHNNIEQLIKVYEQAHPKSGNEDEE